MIEKKPRCSDCESGDRSLNRREFLGTAAAVLALPAVVGAAPREETSETLVKVLFDSLSDAQRKQVCFDWDYKDKGRGLLRTRISNNWKITPPSIKSKFYTAEQQAVIRRIWEGIVNPDWVERFDRQFKDDMDGFAKAQAIALFGKPGEGKFEFVLTGRHGTVRCDGNSAEHLAFGGPIVYGHAASGYYEKFNHPGNVFWHQSEAANALYKMLDGKQQAQALLPVAPDEATLAFQGPTGRFQGAAIKDFSPDQKSHMQGILTKLIEPYRQADREEAVACLKAQGGLDACSLAFYKADDMGEDGIWDNWRVEGPAFVWHYRGAPHVHVWVHVADDPSVALNSHNDSGPLRQK